MAKTPRTSKYIPTGLWGSSPANESGSRMKRLTGMTRKEFLDEISKRDVSQVCKEHTFILTFGNEFRIIPTSMFTNNFQGSIDEALDSDKVSDEFKDFLIFNLELFK